MAKKNKEKTYWPHMIMGFLALGITLSYWTVKSATSVPVQESNEYMMKNQKADYTINEIIEKKALFDKVYTIEITNVTKKIQELENAKRAKAEESIVLASGLNSFTYRVQKKDKSVSPDANVTFVLTRPHTIKDDILVENIVAKEGVYKVDDINITKPGRYLLQFRAKIGDAIGYSELPAYLSPE